MSGNPPQVPEWLSSSDDEEDTAKASTKKKFDPGSTGVMTGQLQSAPNKASKLGMSDDLRLTATMDISKLTSVENLSDGDLHSDEDSDSEFEISVTHDDTVESILKGKKKKTPSMGSKGPRSPSSRGQHRAEAKETAERRESVSIHSDYSDFSNASTEVSVSVMSTGGTTKKKVKKKVVPKKSRGRDRLTVPKKSASTGLLRPSSARGGLQDGVGGLRKVARSRSVSKIPSLKQIKTAGSRTDSGLKPKRKKKKKKDSMDSTTGSITSATNSVQSPANIDGLTGKSFSFHSLEEKKKEKLGLLPSGEQEAVLKKWQALRDLCKQHEDKWKDIGEALGDMIKMLEERSILRLSKERWKRELRLTTVVLLELLRTERSSLFKMACTFAVELAKRVGRRGTFDETLQLLLPALLNRTYVSIAIIAQTAKQTGHDLLALTHYTLAMDQLLDAGLNDKHKQVREAASMYLCQVMLQVVERDEKKLISTADMQRISQLVSKNVRDSDPNTRAATKQLREVLTFYHGVDEMLLK